MQRTIGAGRFLVVASPAYWATRGTPQRPKDLERHQCLPIRALDGTVMDLWAFQRGDEEEAVSAAGWLTTSNAHRELAIAQAVAGRGVLRVAEAFRQLEARRGGHIDGSEPPRWMRGRYRRASASLAQPD